MDEDDRKRIEVILAVFMEWCRTELGIPMSVFRRIETDDDWTVVIKAHAGIEAALNRLILKKLQDERLADIISHMQTGDKNEGKLVFIKAMDLLPVNFIRFIEELGKIRNRLVHNIKNVDFSFVDWAASLDDNQISKLRKILGGLSTGEPEASRVTCDEIRNEPRKMMLLGCVMVLMRILKQEFAPDDPDWPDLSLHQSTPTE